MMWLLKGAFQPLLERAVLSWVNGNLCEQHSYILPIGRVDNVAFHLRFLSNFKMLLFISRRFSLLGTVAASLTNA